MARKARLTRTLDGIEGELPTLGRWRPWLGVGIGVLLCSVASLAAIGFGAVGVGAWMNLPSDEGEVCPAYPSWDGKSEDLSAPECPEGSYDRRLERLDLHEAVLGRRNDIARGSDSSILTQVARPLVNTREFFEIPQVQTRFDDLSVEDQQLLQDWLFHARTGPIRPLDEPLPPTWEGLVQAGPAALAGRIRVQAVRIDGQHPNRLDPTSLLDLADLELQVGLAPDGRYRVVGGDGPVDVVDVAAEAPALVDADRQVIRELSRVGPIVDELFEVAEDVRQQRIDEVRETRSPTFWPVQTLLALTLLALTLASWLLAGLGIGLVFLFLVRLRLTRHTLVHAGPRGLQIGERLLRWAQIQHVVITRDRVQVALEDGEILQGPRVQMHSVVATELEEVIAERLEAFGDRGSVDVERDLAALASARKGSSAS